MTAENAPTEAPPSAGKALLKLFLELGPLILFFYLNASGRTEGESDEQAVGRIIYATQGFLIAILVALPLAWRMERKVPWMSVVTAVMVGVFGGLTIYFGDSTFLKLKPTVASGIFAVLLLGGLSCDKLFLKSLFGMSMPMQEEGWRKLTVRWAGFFIFLALCNEYVRHFWTTDEWVTFKSFGILPMTFVFTMFQVGLMKRYELKPDDSNSAG